VSLKFYINDSVSASFICISLNIYFVPANISPFAFSGITFCNISFIDETQENSLAKCRS
jgi:hypothetical protein